MLTEQSITHWITELKSGDEQAAQAIWDSYFEKLRMFARKKLGDVPRRVQDEDDLALSAIHALCKGAREDRFQKLEDRDDLWQLLVMITSRKASNVRRKQRIRKETGESAILRGPGDETGAGLEEVLVGKPSDDFFNSLSVSCEELLSKLDDKLREVAMLKLAGHTNQEIADIRDRSVKTIERYLKMIRIRWDD